MLDFVFVFLGGLREIALNGITTLDYFCFVAEQVKEPRASHMLSKHSTSQLHPQPLQSQYLNTAKSL
jgi:hypothetical protein